MVTSKPDSDSTLSIISRLCTKPFSGDPAACLSNALHLACQHFLVWHSFRPGYIEYLEDMEAIGQGWKFGAKNQLLVRQYLEHLVIRLLFMNSDFMNLFKFAAGECDIKSTRFSATFSLCIYISIFISIIRQSTTFLAVATLLSLLHRYYR